MNIEELRQRMQQAQRAEKTVDVCLRGDLSAEWERLDRELRELTQRGRASLDDDGGQDLADRMHDIEEEMRESTVTLRLRALPRRTWFRMLAEHPPRDGNPFDKALGLNQESFFDAAIPQSVVDPELTPEDLFELLDLLSGAQYQAITNAIWEINASEVSVPFSPTASRMMSHSDETLRRPSEPESPSDAGTAGSRKRSRSTSTTRKAS